MIYIINGFFLLFINGLFHFNSSKQPLDNPIVPGYFSFPISPGVTTSLSGSFGDLRINHFHAGLDIRTGGAEGKSVFAAAEGYVSRVKIASGGYGNAIYITHPNGLVTVYAHLKEFSAKIKSEVLLKQYAEEKWEIDVSFDSDQIKVNKGELVAFSGNTGGSGGPHLHFEIRDEKENTLDPSSFKFQEILDNTAPFAEFVSFVCKSADARVNGEFGKFDIPVKKVGKGYEPIKPVNLEGEIGIEVFAYDKAQTSPFRLGITKINLLKDGKGTYSFYLDKLSFENKLDMNLHTNYERMIDNGQKLHKCYLEEGNRLDLYNADGKKGILTFEDQKPALVNIEMMDTHGNQSEVVLKINQNALNTVPIRLGKASSKIEKIGHFLKISTKGENALVVLKNQQNTKEIFESYANATEQTFIYDLNDGLYSEILINQKPFKFPVNYQLSKNQNRYKSPHFDADFKSSFYNTDFLNFESDNLKLVLDRDYIPLKGEFEVNWKQIGLNEKKNIYLMGKTPKITDSKWENGEWIFHPKEFGTYQILTDNIPPTVTKIEQSSQKLVFKISDPLAGIGSFYCTVNNEWVLMEYEFKNGLIWSEKLDPEIPFGGEVMLTVVDKAGNSTVYQSIIL